MRKKVLAALLAAAVAGTTVMSGMTTFAAETEGTKAEGGNITIAETADPQNINPLYVVDQTSFDMMQALYSPFFEIVNGEMYYGNGLCESVTANDDASEFTLKLKDGLKWHDGQPITADDVVFTMQVLVDEKQNVPYSSYGYVNDKAVEAEKVDDLTVKISLGSSSAGFLGGLSQVYCIPKHIYDGVENIGESDLNNEPVGSGPFKFEEYKSGEYYKVTKFDDYFDDVNLDSITFKIVKDSSSANAALASGDLDARLISADDYDTVSAYDNVNINTYNSGRVNAMFMNELNEDLQDVKVRQAIAYALNKEEFCQFAFLSEDYAEPADSIFTPDTLYYTKPDNTYDNALSVSAPTPPPSRRTLPSGFRPPTTASIPKTASPLRRSPAFCPVPSAWSFWSCSTPSPVSSPECSERRFRNRKRRILCSHQIRSSQGALLPTG